MSKISALKKATPSIGLVATVLLGYLWWGYLREPVKLTGGFTQPAAFINFGQTKMSVEQFAAHHGVRPEEITFWLGAKSNGGPKVVKGNEDDVLQGIREKVEDDQMVAVGISRGRDRDGKVITAVYALSPYCRENPGGWAALYFKQIPPDGDLACDRADQVVHVEDDWVKSLLKEGGSFWEILDELMGLFGH